MGAWTLARWQRVTAQAVVLLGAILNGGVLIFHWQFTDEAVQAAVVIATNVLIFLGMVIFAGDSTSNTDVAQLMALAHEDGVQAGMAREDAGGI